MLFFASILISMGKQDGFPTKIAKITIQDHQPKHQTKELY